MILLTLLQILSITCDNASNNNTMMEELDALNPYFNKCNRTRCFLHILNLVAKSILKAFELPDKDADDLNDDQQELLSLAEGIDEEEETIQEKREMDLTPDEVLEDDREEWLDQIKLSQEEESKVKKATVPITRILIKVREC